MPAISMFYGIIVYMYFMENKRHKLPHIHAKYQDDEVIVAIPDGDVLEGTIPKPKMKLLQAWMSSIGRNSWQIGTSLSPVSSPIKSNH